MKTPQSDARPADTPSPHTSLVTVGRLALLAADPAPLFVYGTLLFPDVLRVLVDRDPARTPATAPGWRVTALPGRIYPSLVPDAAATAPGHLLTDLTAAEWQTIDAFEAEEYYLARVHPTGTGHAWAYAAPDPDAVPPRPWNADTFASEHLPGYLHRCAAWRRQHDAAE